ncbi:MAG: protein kinase, partial [Planctomycetes bacterium]|nr:protein kinase [Planctomycetota bacterium]
MDKGAMGDPEDKNSDRSDPAPEAEDKFRKISRFFHRLETEKNIDPESYLKRYPELEQELKDLFLKIGSLPDIQPFTEADPWILGDFKILREIGSGGMATVYEAEQISLKRRVALKLLPSHRSLSTRSVLKFQREAEAGGRQTHPGIVAVYGVGEVEKIHYIAQELVEGSISLEKELERLRQEPERPPGYFQTTANFIAKVADALNHAHTSGVVHRDVK